jgi:hypothetical protein
MVFVDCLSNEFGPRLFLRSCPSSEGGRRPYATHQGKRIFFFYFGNAKGGLRLTGRSYARAEKGPSLNIGARIRPN